MMLFYRVKIFSVIALLLLSNLCLAENTQDAKKLALEKVVQRFRAPIQMEGLSATLPEAKKAVASLDQCVEELLVTQITTPGAKGFGGWDPEMTIKDPEISYNGTYFRRTLRLARAWACPASKYYHSPEVATALNRALEFVLPMLEQHKRPNNWWAWDIGIPQRLGETLIFAGDALTPSVQKRAITEQVHLTAKKQLAPRGGANNAWRAFVQVRTAAVTGDPTYLDHAAVTMSQLLEKTDAIQPDYSYFFHGPGLNIGYGFGHWDTVSRYARLVDGTPWELTPAAREVLLAWTKNFFRYNAWKGMWSPWSMGRARTRPYGAGDETAIMRPTSTMDALSVARPMIEMANAQTWPLEVRKELMAMAQEHARGIALPSNDPSLYYLLNHASLEAGNFVEGTKYFPYTDYLTTRRTGWYAAIRLGSVRTKTWFTLAGENLLGYEQAEGSLALMTDPSDFAYDVLVTMPFHDLPGVTRQDGLRRAHDARGESAQTGGVTLGKIGLAGFDYQLTDPKSKKKLQANKSYLILPDAIVLVGSGIRSEGSGEVTTTLALVCKDEPDADWSLDDAKHPWSPQKQTVSGKHYCCLGDVGVVTLVPMDLELETSKITAQSQRINTLYVTDETYTNHFGSVRVKHGKEPTDGTYAAVLLPGASCEAVAAFAKKPTVHVIANRAKAQVLKTDDGITAASFFATERVENVVGSDGPLYLLVKKEENRLTVAMMVPPGKKFGESAARKIWLPGQYRLVGSPEEVADIQADETGTSMTLNLKTGQAFELTLTK